MDTSTESIEITVAAYEKYHELFRHYSTLLFQARVLVITVIFTSFGYTFGLLGSQTIPQTSYTTFGIESPKFISLLAAIVIVLLSSMESKYSFRLEQVSNNLKLLEKGTVNKFCEDYGRPSHWHLILMYEFSIFILLIKFISSFEYWYILLAPSVIIFGFSIYINSRLLKYTRPYIYIASHLKLSNNKIKKESGELRKNIMPNDTQTASGNEANPEAVNSEPTTKKLNPIKRFLSKLKTIKIELMFTIVTLTLSLGQYYQSGISIRINVTSTWKEGYTSEIRNRDSKFSYLYHDKWLPSCNGDATCINSVNASVRTLADEKELYSNKNLGDNIYIKELVSDELPKPQPEQSPESQLKQQLTNDDYLQAALKYRNSLIEGLNTLEAVKAIIESRPLPFRSHLIYKDTLEGRYRDIINERKNALDVFIQAYRDSRTTKRETPAWFVLTNEESNKNDYYIILAVISFGFVILTIVYFLKKWTRTTNKENTAN